MKPNGLVGLTFREKPGDKDRLVTTISMPYAVDVPAGWTLHVRVDARPPKLRLDRSEALDRRCPTCRAAPGATCTGARGKARMTMHQERRRR